MPSNAVEIGLWGANGSGKTLFLANLARAADHLPRRLGVWRVTPDEDTQRWIELRSEELRQGILPGHTQAQAQLTKLRFQLELLEPPAVERRRTRADDVVEDAEISANLEVPDPYGEIFREHVSEPVVAELRDHFVRSQAIVYLFDPARESAARARVRPQAPEGLSPNLAYLDSFLEMMRKSPALELERGRLTHGLAVCVTKFDDPEVFRAAVTGRWVTQDDTAPFDPRIPDELAQRYFQELCAGGADSDAVASQLYKNFGEDRVRYFATSSLGFVADDRARVSAVSKNADGAIEWVSNQGRPINVLEPIVHLVYRAKDRMHRWIDDV